MAKEKVKKKVISEDDVKSDLAKEPESKKLESSSQESEFKNHPKFSKFKKSGEQ